MLFALAILLAVCALGCQRYDPAKSDVAGTGSFVPTPHSEAPQYGGVLEISTRWRTINALSWDNADFPWKHGHDAGTVYDYLFSGDLNKSQRNGGPFGFRTITYMPEEAMRGDLVERWSWESPLLAVLELRRGAMFPGKPGVMSPRELDAHDVVFTFELLETSARKIPDYFDYLERVYARDSHTVVFELSHYNSEWAYRFGWGPFSAILPRELANIDRNDWRNITGSGSFQLVDYIAGNRHRYERNPEYWATETIAGERYGLPFLDAYTYRLLKDESTVLAALRTGKLDIAENLRWLVVDHLRETTPELQFDRHLGPGMVLALRNDVPPFDDVRVRRALSMAIDRQAIVDIYYQGHAEIFAFPMPPDFGDIYVPLREMPTSVRESFSYDPEQARRLLDEAGHGGGLQFKTLVSTANEDHVELFPLVASQLSAVGVDMEIELVPPTAHLSMRTSESRPAGYLYAGPTIQPITALRTNFGTGQLFNSCRCSDPEVDRTLAELPAIRDVAKQREQIRQLTRDVLEKTPVIILPTPYRYTAWWPWVRNYGGEVTAGGARPGPIYTRIWIDQELKERLKP